MSLLQQNDNEMFEFKPDFDSSVESYALTPPRSRNCSTIGIEPLTPLANLKVLLTAASPEIRNRTNSLNESTSSLACAQTNTLFSESTENVEVSYDCIDTVEEEVDVGFAEAEKLCGGNRKEKSLGLLCERFLALFPQYVDPLLEGLSMSLDEIASELGVERRRVYDIVNILESLQLVSRVAKNSYVWHGRNNLSHTLSQLKSMAQATRMAEQLELHLHDRQDDWELLSTLDSSDDCGAASKKEKSLGIMCQKFLMLLMVSPGNMLNLEQSARVLIGCSENESFDSNKYKTKVRRLYDIANVLSSLSLIKKVHVPDCRGKRPVFQYTGPDLSLSALQEGASTTLKRPSTKHSMLSPNVSKDDSENAPVRFLNAPSFKRFSSFQQTSDKKSAPKKTSMCRHASLEQICAVVEQERAKLYSPSASMPGKENIENESRFQRTQPTMVRSAPQASRVAAARPTATAAASGDSLKMDGSPVVVALTRGQLENMLKSMNNKHDGKYLIKMNSVLKVATLNKSGGRQNGVDNGEVYSHGASLAGSSLKSSTPTERTPGHLVGMAMQHPKSAIANLSQSITRQPMAVVNGNKPSPGFISPSYQTMKPPSRDTSTCSSSFWSNLTQSSPDMCIEDLISPVLTAAQRKRMSHSLGGAGSLETPPSVGYGVNKFISLLPPAAKRPSLGSPAAAVIKEPLPQIHSELMAIDSVVVPTEGISPMEGINGFSLPDGISSAVARRLPLYD